MSAPASISFLLANIKTVETFTASTTQSQGNGVLDYGITRVNVVGSNDDACTLPAAKADALVTVFNDDLLQRLELWSGTGDRIDGGSTNGSIKVYARQRITLVAFDDTDWYTIYRYGAGVDFSVSPYATGGQTNATLLEADWSLISSVVTDGDSVKLPPADIGLIRAVTNTDNGQYADCFPNSGHKINDLATDTAYQIAANTSVVFRCYTNALWHTF